MKRPFTIAVLAFLWAGCGVAFAKITPDQAKALPPSAARKIDFAKEIKPIFEASCIKCHGRGRTKGDLSIESRDTLLKGGESGPAIVPGRSAESHLIELIAGLDPDSVMPQKGKRLTTEEIGVLLREAAARESLSAPAGTPRRAPRNRQSHRPPAPALL